MQAYAALLTKPEAFAEQVLLGATKKRLLTSGALAYLLNPNLDKCQGKPDPPHSQVRYGMVWKVDAATKSWKVLEWLNSMKGWCGINSEQRDSFPTNSAMYLDIEE